MPAFRLEENMAINPNTKKVEAIVLTETFLIRGKIHIPVNMRFSDAINRFQKEIPFLPAVEVEIKLLSSHEEIEKRDFILINKDKIVAIIPLE